MKIQKLTIFTSQLQEQLKFYRDNLQMEIRNQSEEHFDLIAGYSVLEFRQREKSTPYHIAFHIPDKQEEEALRWLKERVSILKSNSDEIIDFSNWDAKSVYFYDEDKNVVEFISRGHLNKPESAIFSGKSIVGISEIGIPTENIQEKFDFLQRNCSLEIFDGSFERFCAIGDPQGLFITINKNMKDWFPTGDKAFSSDFEIEFTHKEKSCHLQFFNNELKTV
ncbi:MAG: VOC family protein [Salegentibacter sp.]